MTRWTPPNESEYSSSPPSGPVHIGKRPAQTPPHVHIYAGLHHVSSQIEDVSAQLRDVLLEVAELKRLLKEVTTRTDPAD